MKTAIVFLAVTTLQVNQILLGDENLHIHKELLVQNTTSDVRSMELGGRFYKYWVPSGARIGGGFLSKRFSTVEDLAQAAKSKGHSDIIIETVDSEGRAVPYPRTSMKYPELSYCGMRP
jgi:hypothetical protein